MDLSRYFWIYLCTGKNLKKTKQNKTKPSYSTWAEPEGPTQPTPAQPPTRTSAGPRPAPTACCHRQVGATCHPPPPVASAAPELGFEPCRAPRRFPAWPAHQGRPLGLLNPHRHLLLAPFQRNPSPQLATAATPNTSSAATIDLPLRRLPADEETTRRTARR
jgi:hypothetical protein